MDDRQVRFVAAPDVFVELEPASHTWDREATSIVRGIAKIRLSSGCCVSLSLIELFVAVLAIFSGCQRRLSRARPSFFVSSVCAAIVVRPSAFKRR